jgi:tetratricopeptide (TPR) repeat protein
LKWSYQVLSLVTSLIFFLTVSFGAEKALSPQTSRAIRESENLSLLKDRLPACTVLIRTIKKANKDEVRILRDKLNQLSRYFYTDKGFQDYLLGKELFEKQKFSDALDKLTEAEDLEKGNIDVLHYLELSQLWLKRGALADLTNKKALQINPFDMDVLRDELAILIDGATWAEAEKVGDILRGEEDSSPLTLFWTGLAKVKLNNRRDGEKLENVALTKDPTMPEIYFALASDSTKFMSKYIELCTSKAVRFIDRDPNSCTHLSEARAELAKRPAGTPAAVKKAKDPT